MAFVLLEIINYVEHYGLFRRLKESSSGEKVYEPVRVEHSWNADAVVTNYFLFKLQRLFLLVYYILIFLKTQ